MASSCSSHLPSSIMTSPEKKNLSPIDAVLGNDDLITEILLRVPAKAVLKFKLVSKRWLSIISPKSFALRHTHLNPHTISAIVLKVSTRYRSSPTFNYLSLDGESLVYWSCDFLDFDPNNPGIKYVSQSYNGLLVCSKYPWYFGKMQINYIFNPITRQFAMLPPPPDDEKYRKLMRLVFDPSESPRYRVVCTEFLTSQFKIYVYSSETKGWKLSVNQEPFDILLVNLEDGVSCNGAVHWISPMGNGFSFLLDKECLETIPRPPLPENWQDQNFRYFGESGGHLHFIGILAGNQNLDDLNMGTAYPDMSRDQSTDQFIVVYTMKRGCSKWFVEYRLDMNAIVMAYSEITEREDPTASPLSAEKESVDLLSFINGNDEEGPLLVMAIVGEIMSYSFKDTILKKICSLTFKHATCCAFNYTETLSYV